MKALQLQSAEAQLAGDQQLFKDGLFLARIAAADRAGRSSRRKSSWPAPRGAGEAPSAPTASSWKGWRSNAARSTRKLPGAAAAESLHHQVR